MRRKERWTPPLVTPPCSARSTDGQDQCSQHRWTGPVLAAPMRTSARSTDGQDQCSQHRGTGPVLAAPRKTSARSTDGQDQCSQHRWTRPVLAAPRKKSGRWLPSRSFKSCRLPTRKGETAGSASKMMQKMMRMTTLTHSVAWLRALMPSCPRGLSPPALTDQQRQ